MSRRAGGAAVAMLLVGCALRQSASPPSASGIERTDLAISGVGAPHYRIPALVVTSRGARQSWCDVIPHLWATVIRR